MMKMLKWLGDAMDPVKDAMQELPGQTGQLDVQVILNWVYGVAGILAVIFIVYGGVNYVIAQGEPGKIRTGGQTLAYALVGLAIILLAAAATNFAFMMVGKAGV